MLSTDVCGRVRRFLSGYFIRVKEGYAARCRIRRVGVRTQDRVTQPEIIRLAFWSRPVVLVVRIDSENVVQCRNVSLVFGAEPHKAIITSYYLDLHLCHKSPPFSFMIGFFEPAARNMPISRALGNLKTSQGLKYYNFFKYKGLPLHQNPEALDSSRLSAPIIYQMNSRYKSP